MQTSLDSIQPIQQMKAKEKYNTTLTYCNCPHRINHPQDDCRHIMKLNNENQKNIIQTMSDHIGEVRDIRDKDNTGVEGAVNKIHVHNPVLFGDLMDTVISWAQEHGQVTSDDLHTATNEAYSNNKIIGAVFHVLVSNGLLVVIGSTCTKRKIAHSRRINIYRLTEKVKTMPYRSNCSTSVV